MALFLPGMKSKKSWKNIMCDCFHIKEHNTVALPYSPLIHGITIVLLPPTHSTYLSQVQMYLDTFYVSEYIYICER
jgi:hypothetical protein